VSNQVDITLMRHGRSRADDEGVHEGRYDSPLTEIGRGQVRARAQEFIQRNFGIDLIIASTLQRAQETASILAQALNVPVENDPDWMELDNGPLAGLPFDVADERYPTPAFRNPYEPFHVTGESDFAIHRRGSQAIEKIILRGPGRYLVVAHGGILNAAMRTIINAPLFTNNRGIIFGFGDTGYVQISYRLDKDYWVMKEFKPE